MTAINNEDVQKIQIKIDFYESGEEFDIKTLMGGEWDNVESKQQFGREFKKIYEDGKLTGFKHKGLENSPRRDVYIKL